MLETMLDSAERSAETAAAELRAGAVDSVRAELGREADRLRKLSEINDQVDAGEATHVGREQIDLERHIAHSRLRLDCVRLVWVGPVRDGQPLL